MAFTRPRVKKRVSGSARIIRDSYSNDKVSWWTIRKEVFLRDNKKCQVHVGGRICGAPGVDVHHIISLSRGGTTTKANLITVCEEHHQARHTNRKVRGGFR